MALQQSGLVIKQIHLARAAIHEKLNDAFGPGRMMRRVQQAGHDGSREGMEAPEKLLLAQQVGQRDTAQPAAKTPQKFATRRERFRFGRGHHGFAAEDVWS